jgi:hypothetical protein
MMKQQDIETAPVSANFKARAVGRESVGADLPIPDFMKIRGLFVIAGVFVLAVIHDQLEKIFGIRFRQGGRVRMIGISGLPVGVFNAF